MVPGHIIAVYYKYLGVFDKYIDKNTKTVSSNKMKYNITSMALEKAKYFLIQHTMSKAFKEHLINSTGGRK